MTEPDFRLDRMPTKIADLARTRREAEILRKVSYEATDRAKKIRSEYEATQRKKGRGTDRHPARKIKRENRPFVVWDGEQPRDTGYSLFGCITPDGYDEICYPGLKTKDCLDLIVDVEIKYPDAIHCVFSGDFDVSWILNDLSWRQLGRLKYQNGTMWQGYEITHVPHKWFSVKYGKIQAKVFDVWSYFGSGLLASLVEWKIGPFKDIVIGQHVSDGTPVKIPSLTAIDGMTEVEIIEVFKKLRGEFEWKDIEQIRRYMHIELKYTREMMGKLRDIFLQAGYLPASWHGPGALSRMAATRHGVSQCMAPSPRPVTIATRHAYFGGRFTQHLVGWFNRPVYIRDRTGAYPYAATFLPNLAKGKWRFENEPARIKECLGKFAVFHLTFWDRADGNGVDMEHIRKTVWEMYPLPMRSPWHSGISYPPHVEGWYWDPEARMVADDPRTTFHEVWVFDEDDPDDKPLAWMHEYYERRLFLKRIGNPAEYAFKKITNGWYGQCAQRVGWDRVKGEPPKSHQLEWAGYITSHCRAAMWDMAQRVGWDNVVSIDTDGITTLAPVPSYPGEIGEQLGQYKDDVYTDGVAWQSGVYGLKTADGWVKAKTRGIPKGEYRPERLVQLVKDGVREFKVEQSRFIGYGAAFNGQYEKRNVWVTEPQTYTFGGSGATVHRERDCEQTCQGTVHRLRNNLAPDEDGRTAKDHGFVSAPHYLPWEANTVEMIECMQEEDDITFYYIGSDDI